MASTRMRLDVCATAAREPSVHACFDQDAPSSAADLSSQQLQAQVALD